MAEESRIFSESEAVQILKMAMDEPTSEPELELAMEWAHNARVVSVLLDGVLKGKIGMNPRAGPVCAVGIHTTPTTATPSRSTTLISTRPTGHGGISGPCASAAT